MTIFKPRRSIKSDPDCQHGQSAVEMALVLPLFFHLTVEKTAIADGATTTRVVDYVAICGGVLADLCGSLLLVKALTGRNAPGGASKAQVRGAMALLISALGLMHLLRGLGLIKLGLLG